MAMASMANGMRIQSRVMVHSRLVGGNRVLLNDTYPIGVAGKLQLTRHGLVSQSADDPSDPSFRMARGFAALLLGKPVAQTMSSNVQTSNVQKGVAVIIVGLALMLIGVLAGIPVLWSIGILVAVIGLVLLLLGAAGREVGGRRHYY